MLVIIPAYNEAATIQNVIKSIQKATKYDILVIDDGSKDNTAQLAIDTGVKVITLPFNLGIGGAMQTGYMFAKYNNYDIAIQFDADGQHNPLFLEALVDNLLNSDVDMVIGSRYLAKTSYKSCFSRRLGMIIFTFLILLLTRQRINDTTSGFRAVNKSLIEYFSCKYPIDYPEVDVLVRLYKKGFKVKEVSVIMNERQGGKSSITLIKSFYYMIKVSLSLLINYIRPKEIS